MAEKEVIEPEGAPTPETPAAPAAPTPSYVPADEFKTFQANITGTLDAVRESLQALNASRVHEPPRADTPITDATDEELEAALAEGKGAKHFRTAIAAAEARIRKEFGTRADSLENVAGSSLANMASRLAKPLMKHYDKPYIKKEVDEYVKQLPAKDKLNPENYIVVYNAVAGAHIDEIIADEREAALRAAAAPKGGPTPGAGSGRSNESPTETTVEETFGNEAARELRNRGRSIDRIAQAFGFKDGKEYMKYVREQEGEGSVH